MNRQIGINDSAITVYVLPLPRTNINIDIGYYFILVFILKVLVHFVHVQWHLDVNATFNQKRKNPVTPLIEAQHQSFLFLFNIMSPS